MNIEAYKKLIALMCFMCNKQFAAKQPVLLSMVKRTRLVRVRRLLRPEKDDGKRRRRRRGSKLGPGEEGEDDDDYESGSDEGGKGDGADGDKQGSDEELDIEDENSENGDETQGGDFGDGDPVQDEEGQNAGDDSQFSSPTREEPLSMRSPSALDLRSARSGSLEANQPDEPSAEEKLLASQAKEAQLAE